ncbi:hypothetical protein ACFL2A_01770 [Thermodesulfobacteriota bacterium]
MKKNSLLLVMVVALLLGMSVSAYCHDPKLDGNGDITLDGYLNVNFNYSALEYKSGSTQDTTDVEVDEFGLEVGAGLFEANGDMKTASKREKRIPTIRKVLFEIFILTPFNSCCKTCNSFLFYTEHAYKLLGIMPLRCCYKIRA